MTLRTSRELRLQSPARRIALGLTVVLATLALASGAGAATIKVFILGGQSNADGEADSAGLSPPLSDPQNDVLYYQGNGNPSDSVPENEWMSLQPGGAQDVGEFGPEVSFGRTMADAIGSPDQTVAVVKWATGGSTLANQWAAGGDGTLSGDGTAYSSFQNTVDSALADLVLDGLVGPGDDIMLGGMLWMQGESDATFPNAAADYLTNLSIFLDDVRETFGGDLPVAIGRLSSSMTDLCDGGDCSGLQTVRAAQEALAAADPLNLLVDTDALSMLDGLHFDAAGQVGLGEAFAAAMLSVPEPSSLALLVAFASVGLGLRRR